ncbi:hypothetical protein Aduo_018826 [Ancylostoma duodenale]
MMLLNSEVFYEGTLVCGTPPEHRMAVLQRMRMPNPSIPVAFVDVPSGAIQPVTRSSKMKPKPEPSTSSFATSSSRDSTAARLWSSLSTRTRSSSVNNF